MAKLKTTAGYAAFSTAQGDYAASNKCSADGKAKEKVMMDALKTCFQQRGWSWPGDLTGMPE